MIYFLEQRVSQQLKRIKIIFIYLFIHFDFKKIIQWIELKSVMHGGRTSGAVACMHGR